MALFLWVIFPYLALGTFIGASLYRYAHDQYGWTARSSEIFERRILSVASPLFHWGILFVIGGHVLGLFVPIGWYAAAGIPAELYHTLADIVGGAAGLATWVGLLLLIYRRLAVKRLRLTSSLGDWVSLAALFLAVTSGDAVTLVYNNVVGPFEYRATVAPWLRGIFTLHPNLHLMVASPLIFQIHVVLTFVLFLVWPFTRLVHVFSTPLAYPRRAPIQYRVRGTQGASTAFQGAKRRHQGRAPGA